MVRRNGSRGPGMQWDSWLSLCHSFIWWLCKALLCLTQQPAEGLCCWMEWNKSSNSGWLVRLEVSCSVLQQVNGMAENVLGVCCLLSEPYCLSRMTALTILVCGQMDNNWSGREDLHNSWIQLLFERLRIVLLLQHANAELIENIRG